MKAIWKSTAALYGPATVLLTWALLSSFSFAQQNVPSAAVPSLEIKATPQVQAILRINNRDITMLRATVAGFSPEARSKDIANRVNEIVRTSPRMPVLTARSTREGSAFYLGTQFAFEVVNEDLDEPTGETLDQVSSETLKR